MPFGCYWHDKREIIPHNINVITVESTEKPEKAGAKARHNGPV